MTAIALAAYLCASFGVMPSFARLGAIVGRMTGARFPCESCACGCASAHECWTACCCHSEQERLVWAILNDVEPPEGVHFSAEQWRDAELAVRQMLAQRSSAHDAPACPLCVHDEPETSTDSCSGCASGGSAHACGAPAGLANESPGGAMSALSCKGLNPLILTGVLHARPRDVGVLQHGTPIRWASLHLSADQAFSRTLDAPVPPPRLAAG